MKTGLGAPPPEFLIQWVWGEARESPFLIQPQMVLTLQVQGAHPQDYCSGEFLGPWSHAKGSRRLTVATQALEVLAAVPKLWAAGIAVTRLVPVEGLVAAVPAGAGCRVQV